MSRPAISNGSRLAYLSFSRVRVEHSKAAFPGRRKSWKEQEMEQGSGGNAEWSFSGGEIAPDISVSLVL